ncbi:hypothetical protein BK010_06140 [Tenericutes bacterium MO-XQ]|nr:hypothetical protein BK010_06140 [Tenericutes bacterium MO-XQ]
MRKRIVAAMPMIALALFLFSGLYLENWKLGWVFFLLIPLSWILFSNHIFKRLNDAAPVLALFIFLILGFGFDLWHPGWVVFLLVPVFNMIVERKITPRKLVNVIVIGGFIGLSLYLDEWHPTWLILFLIPIINTIFFPYDNFKFKNKENNWEDRIKKFVNDKIIVDHQKSDDENEDF